MAYTIMEIVREAPIALSVAALVIIYFSYKHFTAKKLSLPVAHLEPGNVTNQLMAARDQVYLHFLVR
jgi:hypothetical protein